jgi:polyphosphate kinase
MARQYSLLANKLLPELAEHGINMRRWEELDARQKRSLSDQFTTEVFPLLTPLSMTASAGRSFPRLPSLGLSLAAVMRRSEDGKHGFGYVPVPASLPRVMSVPGSRDLIQTTEVIIANAGDLFPSFDIQGVHAFRVSRWSDVELDDDGSASLLPAVADEVEERRFKPVIRIEVHNSMPREVRAHLLRELRAERGMDSAILTRADVYEVDGPIDLRALAEFTSLDVPGGRFQTFEPSDPFATMYRSSMCSPSGTCFCTIRLSRSRALWVVSLRNRPQTRW